VATQLQSRRSALLEEGGQKTWARPAVPSGAVGESEKTSFLANWRHTSEILLRHLSIIGLKHIITLERTFGIVRLDDVVHVQFSKK